MTTKCTWEYMNVRELIWQEGEKCIMVSFTVLLHVGSACCCLFHAVYKLGMWKLNYNIAEGVAISECSLHLRQLSSLTYSIPCGHWWTVFCTTLQSTSWCPHRLYFQGSSRRKCDGMRSGQHGRYTVLLMYGLVLSWRSSTPEIFVVGWTWRRQAFRLCELLVLRWEVAVGPLSRNFKRITPLSSHRNVPLSQPACHILLNFFLGVVMWHHSIHCLWMSGFKMMDPGFIPPDNVWWSFASPVSYWCKNRPVMAPHC